MQISFGFSPADALQINRKLMEQKIPNRYAVNNTRGGSVVSGAAAKNVRIANVTFSVKDVNEAMTKARTLMAA
jgi:hypothetical protein